MRAAKAHAVKARAVKWNQTRKTEEESERGEWVMRLREKGLQRAGDSERDASRAVATRHCGSCHC